MILPYDARQFYRKILRALWAIFSVAILTWAFIVILLFVDQVRHGESARHCCANQPKEFKP